MKKFRNIICIAAIVIIITHILDLNFDNLSWKENSSNYRGIIPMILIIIAMVLSNKKDAKEKDNGKIIL